MRKAEDYATAVHLGMGVFVRIILQLDMRGQGWNLPPKKIRGDQWISDEAQVTKIFVCSLMQNLIIHV